jgi:hypothetical protein
MLTKILHFIKDKITNEKKEYKEFFFLRKHKNIVLIIEEEKIPCKYYNLSFTDSGIVFFKKFKNVNRFSIQYNQLSVKEENENEIVLFYRLYKK